MSVGGPTPVDPRLHLEIQEVKNNLTVKVEEETPDASAEVVKQIPEGTSVVNALIDTLIEKGKLPKDFDLEKYQKDNPGKSPFEDLVEHLDHQFETESDDPDSAVEPHYYYKNGKAFLAFKVTYEVVLKSKDGKPPESLKFSQMVYTDQSETENICLPPERNVPKHKAYSTQLKQKVKDLRMKLRNDKSLSKQEKQEIANEILTLMNTHKPLLTAEETRDKAYRLASDYCKTMEVAVSPNCSTHKAMYSAGLTNQIAKGTLQNLVFSYASAASIGTHTHERDEWNKKAEIAQVELGGKFMLISSGTRMFKKTTVGEEKLPAWNIIEPTKWYDASKKKWIKDTKGLKWKEMVAEVKATEISDTKRFFRNIAGNYRQTDRDLPMVESAKHMTTKIKAGKNPELKRLNELEETSSKDFDPEMLKMNAADKKKSSKVIMSVTEEMNEDDLELKVHEQMDKDELELNISEQARVDEAEGISEWQFDPIQYATRLLNRLELMKHDLVNILPQHLNKLKPDEMKKIVNEAAADLKKLKSMPDGPERTKMIRKLQAVRKELIDARDSLAEFDRIWKKNKDGELPQERIIGQLKKLKPYIPIDKRIGFAKLQMEPHYTLGKGKDVYDEFNKPFGDDEQSLREDMDFFITDFDNFLHSKS